MKRFIALAVGLCLLSGCSFFFPPPDGNGDTQRAALKPFGSEEELAQYFSSQINVQNNQVSVPTRDEVQGGADGDAAGGAGGNPNAAPEAPTAESSDDSVGSFSGTTVQEDGVDEADVVKTDGTFLYVIQSNYDSEGSTLKIIRADQMAVVGEIALDGYARELYLHGSRVVALTETYGNYYFFDAVPVEPRPEDGDVADGSEGSSGSGGTAEGDAAVSDVDPGSSDLIAPDEDVIYPEFTYSRPKTIVTVIDAAVPNVPNRVSLTEFDGTQSSSRMIDGMLHMVISNYQNYYFDILPALGRPEMDGAATDPNDLLPHYRHVDAQGVETEGLAVTWENVYRPEVPDGFGVLTVVSMDADNSDAFRAVGVVAEPGLIYSSTDALYVTNTNYDFRGDMRSTTDVYKFRYEGADATPVAAGRVNGRILNQYSMGESNGFLRIATTSDPVFDETGVVARSTNNVYVVEESAGELRVVGSLEDLAPGETIQSARFLGDRGYLVTFEQIDPLFTLDLADPTSPKAVGELKVPGFSTFIVPMDENNILTIGQYIPEGDEQFFRPWGVQLSIFNVSDFANPTLAHQVVIGADTGAYSEAQWNPKAFTYFAEQGLVALPVSIYEPYDYSGGGVTVIDVDVDGTADDSASGGGSSGSEGDEVMATEPAVDGDIDRGGVDGSDGDAAIDEPEPDFAPYIPGGFDGLYVYDVSAANGFTERGRLSTRFEDAGYYYASFTRGVFINTDVYAVTDNGVRSVSLADMTASARELLLRDPNPYYLDPVEPGVDPEMPVDNIDTPVVDDGTVTDPVGGGTEPGRPVGLEK